jgi:hypothetical protein
MTRKPLTKEVDRLEWDEQKPGYTVVGKEWHCLYYYYVSETTQSTVRCLSCADHISLKTAVATRRWSKEHVEQYRHRTFWLITTTKMTRRYFYHRPGLEHVSMATEADVIVSKPRRRP